jgi:hypothetical protein
MQMAIIMIVRDINISTVLTINPFAFTTTLEATSAAAALG